MIRKVTIALALVVGMTTLSASAEPGRRRPVTNPQATIEGVIAGVTSEGFRVQTAGGSVNVALTPATELIRSGSATAVPALGDYTLTEGTTAKDGSISANRVSLFTVPASVASGETIRIEGKVASVTPETSELKLETFGGALLTVTANDTTLIRRDGVTIALKDINAGDIARVVGKPTGERTLLALQIDIRAMQEPRPRTMVAGEVLEIRAAERALVVRPVAHGPRPAVDATVIVRTDDKTEIYRKNERIRFDDIRKGDFVLAHGEIDSSKALLAARIDVADLPEPAPKFAGKVIEVSPATRQFTLAVERGWMQEPASGPVTVVVNDDSKIYRDREQVRFDAIKPGDFVVVSGEWRDDRALVASVVRIVTLPPVPPMPAIVGEIVAIEPATRTLIVRVRAMRPLETQSDGTVKVLVGDDSTVFRNGQPSRFAELTVGEFVLVIGEVRDDGAIVARRVDAIVPPSPATHLMGVVASVSERSIDVIIPQPFPTFMEVRVTILTDDATQVFRNGERVKLSAIKLGDMVLASGEKKDDRHFFATKIEAKGMGMNR